MKKENFIKLYEYLLLHSGEELNLKDILDKFGAKKPDKKKKYRKDSIGEKVETLLEFLRALEIENLISIKKKIIVVQKPFILFGKISLSKRGDGFVKLSSGSEIFIPAELTGGAISGDKVEVIPIRIGKKERLEGEVRDIRSRVALFTG